MVLAFTEALEDEDPEVRATAVRVLRGMLIPIFAVKNTMKGETTSSREEGIRVIRPGMRPPRSLGQLSRSAVEDPIAHAVGPRGYDVWFLAADS